MSGRRVRALRDAFVAECLARGYREWEARQAWADRRRRVKRAYARSGWVAVAAAAPPSVQ